MESEESSEKWKIPTSTDLDNVADEKGITPYSKPELGSVLSTLNQITRKAGVSPLGEEENFRMIFSAIYYYEKVSESIRNQTWDQLKRAFNYELKSVNKRMDINTLRKVTYILCALMNQTIKRSRSEKADCSIFEHRFELCCQYLQKLIKGNA